MKILKLTAENVKRLKAVEITPDGNTVVVSGKNGAGKSSILDSIWFALGGAPATKETSRVVRDGEKEAHVTLDLGDIIVTKTWSGDKATLSVTSADGAKFPSPQKMLDELVGRLSFDPLAFSQMADKEQLATLLDLVELGFDPDELSAQRKTLYDNRTEIGREIKTLEGRLVGIPTEDVSLEPVSVTDLAKRLATASTAKASFDRLTDEVWELTGRLNAATDALEALGDFDNPADIAEEMAGVEETNRRYEAVQTHHRVAQELSVAKDNSDAITTQLASLDKTKGDALAAAEMPVAGLAFDDEGVTFEGIPFRQCSAAERLRVSIAMAIAVNPKLRVIRITDGSLLDSENLALIGQMAADNDFQCWIERVSDGDGVGILIEDGEVVEEGA